MGLADMVLNVKKDIKMRKSLMMTAVAMMTAMNVTGQTTSVSAVSKQQPSARIYRIDCTPADENASGVVIEKGVKRMRNEKLGMRNEK